MGNISVNYCSGDGDDRETALIVKVMVMMIEVSDTVK